MIETIAAKHLLAETSCYQCIFLDNVANKCSLHLDDLPKELYCDDFSSSILDKLHAKWSPASLKDIETYFSLDSSAKEELCKIAGIELEKNTGLPEDDV